MQTKSAQFYNSMAWQNTRRSYRKSVGGLCERCLKHGVIASADVVHHIVPLTEETVNDLNLSLNWDNLQALCTKCHAEVHSSREKERAMRRYEIRPDGSVTIQTEPPGGGVM